MQPGADLLAGARWIHETVGNLGGSVSGTYLDLIPEKAALPAVRYHVQAPSDVSVVSGERVLVNVSWLIVVVREGLEVAPLVPIVAALDQALHEKNGVADGYRIECIRLAPFNLIEPDDSGVQVRHAGGIYRTLIGPT